MERNVRDQSLGYTFMVSRRVFRNVHQAKWVWLKYSYLTLI